MLCVLKIFVLTKVSGFMSPLLFAHWSVYPCQDLCLYHYVWKKVQPFSANDNVMLDFYILSPRQFIALIMTCEYY